MKQNAVAGHSNLQLVLFTTINRIAGNNPIIPLLETITSKNQLITTLALSQAILSVNTQNPSIRMYIPERFNAGKLSLTMLNKNNLHIHPFPFATTQSITP
jgi:hypothetical protein